jgi:uncharacterized membrane protein HdeD (DUF308 family)
MADAAPNYGMTVEGVDVREAGFDPSEFWWMYLIVGALWIIASLVILQFDEASVATISLIVGIMFIAAATQQIIIGLISDSLRWLWIGFGVLFLIAGILCLAQPEKTFHGMADMLGFLLMSVGVWWTVRAFVVRAADPLWWLGLIGGVLLMVMAFWTAGQFFIEKAYTLVVFAGIWALMHGLTDIVRAFQVRAVHKSL